MACATATATVVLPTPPGPTIVKKRRAIRSAAMVRVSSSRPTIRPGNGGGASVCKLARLDDEGAGSARREWSWRLTGGDEAITSARDRRDVPGRPFAIAQRFAQTCDLCSETARVHHEVAPHARDQFLVADGL